MMESLLVVLWLFFYDLCILLLVVVDMYMGGELLCVVLVGCFEVVGFMLLVKWCYMC